MSLEVDKWVENCWEDCHLGALTIWQLTERRISSQGITTALCIIEVAESEK